MAELASGARVDPDYAALMRSRAHRLVFALATFVVAWLVSTPAFAAEASMLDALFEREGNASFAPRSSEDADANAANANGAANGIKAPLCDRRGAITFAPPPQMQDVEVSLDVGTFDDCESTPSVERASHARNGRAPLPVSPEAARDPVTHTTAAAIPRTSFEVLPVPAASEVRPRPGFRSTVDRPPRA